MGDADGEAFDRVGACSVVVQADKTPRSVDPSLPTPEMNRLSRVKLAADGEALRVRSRSQTVDSIQLRLVA
jgi:hypothetical protein